MVLVLREPHASSGSAERKSPLISTVPPFALSSPVLSEAEGSKGERGGFSATCRELPGHKDVSTI
jgi:hypothetical protein